MSRIECTLLYQLITYFSDDLKMGNGKGLGVKYCFVSKVTSTFFLTR